MYFRLEALVVGISKIVPKFNSFTLDEYVQIIELPSHPFFIGVQFHPEFKSRPGKPSPPFLGTFSIVTSHIFPFKLLIDIFVASMSYTVNMVALVNPF